MDTSFTSLDAMLSLYMERGVELSVCLRLARCGDIAMLTELVCLILDRHSDQPSAFETATDDDVNAGEKPQSTSSVTTHGSTPHHSVYSKIRPSASSLPSAAHHIQQLPAGIRICERAVVDAFMINERYPRVNIDYYLPLEALMTKNAKLIDFFRILRQRNDWTSDSFRQAIHTSEFYNRLESAYASYAGLGVETLHSWQYVIALELLCEDPEDDLRLWFSLGSTSIEPLLHKLSLQPEAYVEFYMSFLANIYTYLFYCPSHHLFRNMHYLHHVLVIQYDNEVEMTIDNRNPLHLLYNLDINLQEYVAPPLVHFRDIITYPSNLLQWDTYFASELTTLNEFSPLFDLIPKTSMASNASTSPHDTLESEEFLDFMVGDEYGYDNAISSQKSAPKAPQSSTPLTKIVPESLNDFFRSSSAHYTQFMFDSDVFHDVLSSTDGSDPQLAVSNPWTPPYTPEDVQNPLKNIRRELPAYVMSQLQESSLLLLYLGIFQHDETIEELVLELKSLQLDYTELTTGDASTEHVSAQDRETPKAMSLASITQRATDIFDQIKGMMIFKIECHRLLSTIITLIPSSIWLVSDIITVWFVAQSQQDMVMLSYIAASHPSLSSMNWTYYHFIRQYELNKTFSIPKQSIIRHTTVIYDKLSFTSRRPRTSSPHDKFNEYVSKNSPEKVQEQLRLLNDFIESDIKPSLDREDDSDNDERLLPPQEQVTGSRIPDLNAHRAQQFRNIIVVHGDQQTIFRVPRGVLEELRQLERDTESAKMTMEEALQQLPVAKRDTITIYSKSQQALRFWYARQGINVYQNDDEESDPDAIYIREEDLSTAFDYIIEFQRQVADDYSVLSEFFVEEPVGNSIGPQDGADVHQTKHDNPPGGPDQTRFQYLVPRCVCLELARFNRVECLQLVLDQLNYFSSSSSSPTSRHASRPADGLQPAAVSRLSSAKRITFNTLLGDGISCLGHLLTFPQITLYTVQCLLEVFKTRIFTNFMHGHLNNAFFSCLYYYCSFHDEETGLLMLTYLLEYAQRPRGDQRKAFSPQISVYELLVILQQQWYSWYYAGFRTSHIQFAVTHLIPKKYWNSFTSSRELPQLLVQTFPRHALENTSCVDFSTCDPYFVTKLQEDFADIIQFVLQPQAIPRLSEHSSFYELVQLFYLLRSVPCVTYILKNGYQVQEFDFLWWMLLAAPATSPIGPNEGHDIFFYPLEHPHEDGFALRRYHQRMQTESAQEANQAGIETTLRMSRLQRLQQLSQRTAFPHAKHNGAADAADEEVSHSSFFRSYVDEDASTHAPQYQQHEHADVTLAIDGGTMGMETDQADPQSQSSIVFPAEIHHRRLKMSNIKLYTQCKSIINREQVYSLQSLCQCNEMRRIEVERTIYHAQLSALDHSQPITKQQLYQIRSYAREMAYRRGLSDIASWKSYDFLLGAAPFLHVLEHPQPCLNCARAFAQMPVRIPALDEDTLRLLPDPILAGADESDSGGDLEAKDPTLAESDALKSSERFVRSLLHDYQSWNQKNTPTAHHRFIYLESQQDDDQHPSENDGGQNFNDYLLNSTAKSAVNLYLQLRHLNQLKDRKAEQDASTSPSLNTNALFAGFFHHIQFYTTLTIEYYHRIFSPRHHWITFSPYAESSSISPPALSQEATPAEGGGVHFKANRNSESLPMAGFARTTESSPRPVSCSMQILHLLVQHYRDWPTFFASYQFLSFTILASNYSLYNVWMHLFYNSDLYIDMFTSVLSIAIRRDTVLLKYQYDLIFNDFIRKVMTSIVPSHLQSVAVGGYLHLPSGALSESARRFSDLRHLDMEIVHKALDDISRKETIHSTDEQRDLAVGYPVLSDALAPHIDTVLSTVQRSLDRQLQQHERFSQLCDALEGHTIPQYYQQFLTVFKSMTSSNHPSLSDRSDVPGGSDASPSQTNADATNPIKQPSSDKIEDVAGDHTLDALHAAIDGLDDNTNTDRDNINTRKSDDHGEQDTFINILYSDVLAEPDRLQLTPHPTVTTPQPQGFASKSPTADPSSEVTEPRTSLSSAVIEAYPPVILHTQASRVIYGLVEDHLILYDILLSRQYQRNMMHLISLLILIQYLDSLGNPIGDTFADHPLIVKVTPDVTDIPVPPNTVHHDRLPSAAGDAQLDDSTSSTTPPASVLPPVKRLRFKPTIVRPDFLQLHNDTSQTKLSLQQRIEQVRSNLTPRLFAATQDIHDTHEEFFHKFTAIHKPSVVFSYSLFLDSFRYFHMLFAAIDGNIPLVFVRMFLHYAKVSDVSVCSDLLDMFYHSVPGGKLAEKLVYFHRSILRERKYLTILGEAETPDQPTLSDGLFAGELYNDPLLTPGDGDHTDRPVQSTSGPQSSGPVLLSSDGGAISLLRPKDHSDPNNVTPAQLKALIAKIDQLGPRVDHNDGEDQNLFDSFRAIEHYLDRVDADDDDDDDDEEYSDDSDGDGHSRDGTHSRFQRQSTIIHAPQRVSTDEGRVVRQRFIVEDIATVFPPGLFCFDRIWHNHQFHSYMITSALLNPRVPIDDSLVDILRSYQASTHPVPTLEPQQPT